MVILEISGKLNIGGAQAVAANIAKYAPDKYRFVYLVFEDDIGEYEADIRQKGHTIIHIPSPTGRQWQYFRTLLRIMREEKIDVVHCHTMFNCGIVMFAAKLAGVRGRISHSHTIRDDAHNTFVRNLYKRAMRILMYTCGTDYLACGVDAGNILYGKKWFSRHGQVIRNGIELARFRYSGVVREKLRTACGWDGSFVIGHVGHYVHVKNQSFLIALMPALLQLRPEAKLVMFGDGPDRQVLQKQIDEAGLSECVFLAGNKRNIDDYLSSLDVFAFPSLYEGTPLALIEAQANGLPCVISDAIPADACLTDEVIALSLDTPERWVKALSSAVRTEPERYADKVMERYGDVHRSMEDLYRLFDRY